jgi:transposase
MIVAGVDCHKDTHTIAFVDELGRLVETLVIQTDEMGYQTAMQRGREVGVIVWGLEGTGCYAALFAQRLSEAGLTVFEVPGSVTKRNRKHSTHRGKSDEIDAHAIAQALLREQDRLPVYTFAAEQEAIRLRHLQRERLVAERTAAINRIRAAAVRLGLDVPKTLESKKTLEQFEEHVCSVKGRNEAVDALVDDILFALEDLRRLAARIQQVEVRLDPLVRRLAPEELLAMRGVGLVVAAGILGNAGDFRNCRNADAFAMRCGTAPVPYSSGKRANVRVNPYGNRKLNYSLHVIALSQVRSVDHRGRLYYDRKRAEGKSHAAAMRSLKRQLTKVVFYKLKPIMDRLSSSPTPLTAAA